MKLLWIFLLSGPALAAGSGSSSGAGELVLSGRVFPTLEIGIQPFNDGYSLRNLGNTLTLFQIGSRDRGGRQVAWLRADEQLFLRTDFLQKTGESVQIRILAP